MMTMLKSNWHLNCNTLWLTFPSWKCFVYLEVNIILCVFYSLWFFHAVFKKNFCCEFIYVWFWLIEFLGLDWEFCLPQGFCACVCWGLRVSAVLVVNGTLSGFLFCNCLVTNYFHLVPPQDQIIFVFLIAKPILVFVLILLEMLPI